MDSMGDLDILGIAMEVMVDMEGMEVTENLTHMVTKLTIGHRIFTNPGQDLVIYVIIWPSPQKNVANSVSSGFEIQVLYLI